MAKCGSSHTNRGFSSIFLISLTSINMHVHMAISCFAIVLTQRSILTESDSCASDSLVTSDSDVTLPTWVAQEQQFHHVKHAGTPDSCNYDEFRLTHVYQATCTTIVGQATPLIGNTYTNLTESSLISRVNGQYLGLLILIYFKHGIHTKKSRQSIHENSKSLSSNISTPVSHKEW